MFGCEIGRDRGLPIALPIAEGVLWRSRGVKQKYYSIQPVEGATKAIITLHPPPGRSVAPPVPPPLRGVACRAASQKVWRYTRRRTNVQQLTCNIDLPCSFYYHFLSVVLIELKPLVLKWKVLGEK